MFSVRESLQPVKCGQEKIEAQLTDWSFLFNGKKSAPIDGSVWDKVEGKAIEDVHAIHSKDSGKKIVSFTSIQ